VNPSARLLPVLAAVLSTLAGCWGGGQGNQVTSLDGQLVIGDLDGARFVQLCHDIDAWNQNQFGSAQYRTVLCEIEAAASLRLEQPSPSAEQATCQGRARQCEAGRGGKPNVALACEQGASRCALKVSDVEQCLYDLAYDMNEVMCTAPICADICGIVDRAAVDPPACRLLESHCPELRFTRPSFQWLVELDACTAAAPATHTCVWHN
jgi:hypothetical protein